MKKPLAARLERRPPFRQLEAVYASELFVVEAGIGRAPGGRRIVRGGYALHAGQASPARLRLAEDGFREIRPGRLARAGHMKDAA